LFNPGEVILRSVVTDDLTAGSGVAPALNLPSFSGPLDLLLHLIRQNKVSIYDIPISRICDQYHEFLSQMNVLNLEVAAEFLWMASWLLQLKSKMLLPTRKDEEGEDPRIELVERLLEYRRVKELASALYEIDVVRRCLRETRIGINLKSDETTLDWEDVDLRALAQSYLDAMQAFATAHPPPLEVLPLKFSVEEKMSQLADKVVGKQAIPLFGSLLKGAQTEEVIASVVALLELVRLDVVLAEQRLEFSEIFLRRGKGILTLKKRESVGEAYGK
jgi:segregation and condensation protein A